MKKILTGVLSLALALSVVAPVAASAQVSSTFNTNLTIGSRGSDVVALQSFLEMKGLLTIPAGVSKGYFGSLTKAAVSAYQVSKGIQPTAGYFGPITRAAVNSDMGGVVVTTGGTPGCPVGAMYNFMTGQPCTAVPTTSTTEGSLTVNLAATPSNNSNVQTSVDVPVYGLEFKAKIADVAVQTVDLQVGVTLTGSAENPATLINTIKVWDGSNVIATVPVTSTTFTKDSNQVYYVRLSGLNFNVPKDATKNLVISFSTNSIDTSRVVTLKGYGSSSVRSVSGNGISSFSDVSGSAYTRTHTFAKPGTSNLTLSAASSPLRSINNRVNTTGTFEFPALVFNVRSDTGPSTILTVVATSTVSGEAAANLVYNLYDGSTRVDSKTGSTSVTFNNLTIAVGQDMTKTLRVEIVYPATTTSVTTPYIATTTISSVTYEKPNGSSATVSTAVNGVGQYVYTAAPKFAVTSAPTISVDGVNQQGSSTALTAKFYMNVTAMGGTMTKLANTSVVVRFAKADGTTVLATTQVSTNPDNDIADGSTVPVTITAATSSVPLSSGLWSAYVESIAWTVGAVSATQTYGLDDFKTPGSVNVIE